MKPTFKNDPPYTGLSAIGRRPGAAVKVNGKRCGSILGLHGFRGHRVQIAVKTDEAHGWTWVMPSVEIRDIAEMKQWVRDNFSRIVGDNQLHFFED